MHDSAICRRLGAEPRKKRPSSNPSLRVTSVNCPRSACCKSTTCLLKRIFWKFQKVRESEGHQIGDNIGGYLRYLCWKEIAHPRERQTCLGGPAHFSLEDMIKR